MTQTTRAPWATNWAWTDEFWSALDHPTARPFLSAATDALASDDAEDPPVVSWLVRVVRWVWGE